MAGLGRGRRQGAAYKVNNIGGMDHKYHYPFGNKPASTGEEIISFSGKKQIRFSALKKPPLFSCNRGHPAGAVSSH
jgi:hypothetical protein